MLSWLHDLFLLRIVSARWRMPCFLVLGMAAGAGLFTAYISRAASYLSDSPETCVNCHVMNTHYVTWRHGSHGRVATCNDCHVPHTNVFSHYAFKARDGLWHATVFTMRWEPEVIRLSAAAVPVVEENCRRCHAAVVHETSLAAASEERRCWDCHRDVPHGTVRSQSAGPAVFRPALPAWNDPWGSMRVGGRPPVPENRPAENGHR